MLDISVIVCTKNEEKNLPACLAALKGFDDVWVVDSLSRDKTAQLAQSAGVQLVPFSWNGQYPKKRQWCLQNLKLKHPYVLFIDADEIVTPELLKELQVLKLDKDGYFIKGHYGAGGKVMRYGLQNNKLCLFNHYKMAFPDVADADLKSMGEIEGHYQPTYRQGAEKLGLGQLKGIIRHDGFDDMRGWAFRHERYARWEAEMNRRNAWPADPVRWREGIKTWLRRQPLRPQLMFIISYILLLGFLDGKAGYELARRKYSYYKLIGLLANNAA